MSDQVTADHLDTVSETALLNLYSRAYETERTNGLLYDPKAIEIVDHISYDFERFQNSPPVAYSVIRTKVIDDIVENIIRGFPDINIVQLGSGFDTRYYRIDTKSTTWYDIDLPQVIELRRKVDEETENRKFIPASIFETDWEATVQEGQFLFISEGTLIYYDNETISSFVSRLAENFPDSRLVLDIVPTLLSKWTRFRQKFLRSSLFERDQLMGITNADMVTSWHPALTLEDENYFLQQYSHPHAELQFIQRVPILRQHLCQRLLTIAF